MDVEKVSEIISIKFKEMPMNQSLLVGISGIDGSGKGFVTAKLVEAIRQKSVNAVGINIDAWLNLPQIRLTKTNTAENFYKNAIRFEEMFDRLILPLKRNRVVHLVADFGEETDQEYRKREYVYENVDVILLEGIFLFKAEFIERLVPKIWIECSFETALKRAIARAQEGLSPEETISAYEAVYFPTHRIHFENDDPKPAADIILNNDSEQE